MLLRYEEGVMVSERYKEKRLLGSGQFPPIGEKASDHLL